MRINHNTPAGKQGSVLAITLMICVFLGFIVGSYLYLIQTQRRSVARSQQWNHSLVVAEAGVEEAMAMLNSGVIAPNIAVFPWTGSSGTAKNDTNRPASKFGNSYYQVFITNGLPGANPGIISKAYSP